jgi:hypothetical protein
VFQLVALDYAILATLADEGTSFGYQPLGKQVKSLVKELNAPLPPEQRTVTGSMLNGRLRMMKQLGLVVDVIVLPTSRGLGWQRTKKAKRLLAEKAAQGGPTVAELEEAHR